MVVHLLAQKSSQNNAIKGAHEETLRVTFESAPKISLEEVRKIVKKCQELDAFEVAVDGSLDDIIKGAPLNLSTRPSYLIILYRAEETELSTF